MGRFPKLLATWGCVGYMCFPHEDPASISGQPQIEVLAFILNKFVTILTKMCTGGAGPYISLSYDV